MSISYLFATAWEDGLVEGEVAERDERALAERERRVGHDEIGIDLPLRAEAGAAGHALCGELNEKMRGSSPQRDPCFGQAKFSLNSRLS